MMTWDKFKGLTLAEIIELVGKWKAGQDSENAAAFARDFLDNVLFPFKEGSTAERASDALLAILGPQVFPILGARLAGMIAAVLSTRPLDKLPI